MADGTAATNLGSRVTGMVLLGIMFWSAWTVYLRPPYTPASDIGYALGLIGATLMLLLLSYPLRKHLPWLRRAGALRHWFRLHMICGVAGPACIMFHATMQTSSINATVAYTCMIIVALSGIVGRFLYGRIHHGMRGRRATDAEKRAAVEAHYESLSQHLARTPQLRSYVQEFAGLSLSRPQGLWSGLVFLTLAGARRRRAVRAARRMLWALIEQGPAPDIGRPGINPAQLSDTIDAIDTAYRAMQAAASFATYERLFALWHVAHVPFVYLFILTAIAHVVAVHVY